MKLTLTQMHFLIHKTRMSMLEKIFNTFFNNSD